jgi:hypothetical protein
MGTPMIDSQDVAGITCIGVMDALSAYADGDIDRALAMRIEAHVAGCRRCGQFGTGFVQLLQVMRTRLRDAEPVPRDVAARLRAALETTR